MPALGMWARLCLRLGRAARWLGLRLLDSSGPLPTSCLVLRIADGSRQGRRVRLLNVRDVTQADGFLVVTDLYGRRSLYRLDTLLAARATDAVPQIDILRGAVEVA